MPAGQVCKALVTQLVTSCQLTYAHSYRKLNRILPSPDDFGRMELVGSRDPSYPALQGIATFETRSGRTKDPPTHP